ncbi:MAG: hypothetical protein M1497_12625 [Nitrospirae bacterium]|nr:hypothetical protein [Nitrospirota bacterium]
MRNLRQSLLKEPLILRVFRERKGAYLVGGYLRDALRGVRSGDIDFVVRDDVKEFVARIFPETDKTVISFKDSLLVRVVAGEVFADFSELKGELKKDLSRRDFTMNAIAWSPEEGLIDPLGGSDDIARGRIRAVSEDNFVADPLRLLRAYRFVAELGWELQQSTRKMIRKLKGLLREAAAERITQELFKLLNSERYLRALKLAWKDSLLEEIIIFKNTKIRDNIKALSRLDRFLRGLPRECHKAFGETFSQGLSYLGLLRAEQLFHGSDPGKNGLSPSGPVRRRLQVATKLLDLYGKGRLDDSRLFDLFEEAGDGVRDFAFLTTSKKIVKKAGHFLGMRPVMRAEKVIEVAGLEAGPQIGRVLSEMKKQQFLGEIRDETDAAVWLGKRV